MRNILKEHRQKHENIYSLVAMAFLNTTNPWRIKFGKKLLNLFYFIQRLGYKITKKRTSNTVNKTMVRPSFPTEIITLLDKPLPKDITNKPFRELLKIESHDKIPILYDKNKVNGDSKSVLYFPGCGSERMFSQIGLATIALLYNQGIKVVLPPSYLCCGYPQKVVAI